MKQEVSRTMAAKKLKILTLLLSLAFFSVVEGKVLTQKKMKDNLRWELKVSKGQILLNSDQKSFSLKTLNYQLYRKIVEDLQKIKLHKYYFKKIDLDDGKNADNHSVIKIHFSENSVKNFSFYKSRDEKYVIDFWSEDSGNKKVLNIKSKNKKKLIPKNKLKTGKVTDKKNISKNKNLKKKKEPKKIKRIINKEISKLKGFRDFRYGSSFFWNYKAMSPTYKELIDVSNKTADFFYKIKDRNYSKNDKEAHLQLTINLYRKKKYGLMNRSIKLFENKYGVGEFLEFHNFIKANAILKDNINKGNRKPLKAAINILSSIAKKTDDYELSKGILKYIVSYYTYLNEEVLALEAAKSLYVKSRSNFDFEESTYAAEIILSKLSSLNQLNKINELLREKEIVDLLPKQKVFAYQSFILLKSNKEKDLIALYEKELKNMAKPIAKEFLFNTAEAYFRLGKYKKAIKIFDEFLTNYSFSKRSGQAHLRISLSYEILDKDSKSISELYKNTINKANDFETSYEAKIRYVAFENLRNKNISKSNIEKRIFLELKNKESSLNKNLKKLLWLVRLRLFIVDKDYKKALTYLNALPLIKMKNREKGVFLGDGAEIVVGIIQANFLAGNFSEVIKVWEIYKDLYVNKVGHDPFLNYLIAHSFLKLKFYDSFSDFYKKIGGRKSKYKRTFPIWVERIKVKNIMDELRIFKDFSVGDLVQARKDIKSFIKKNPKNNRGNLFLAKLNYKEGKFKESIKDFERYFTNLKGDVSASQNELADIINEYTGSLYELGEIEKFKKMGKAFVKDVKNLNKKNNLLKSSVERLSYLILELDFSKDDPEINLSLEKRIKEFVKNNPKSIYMDRSNYLLGMVLIRNRNDEEGEKILRSILEKESAPIMLKELVNSKLTELKISKRTI